jgi:pellino protein
MDDGCNQDDGSVRVYGQFVEIGNTRRGKHVLRRRPVPNGMRLVPIARDVGPLPPPRQSAVPCTHVPCAPVVSKGPVVVPTHTITLEGDDGAVTTIVGYGPDRRSDSFQLGRDPAPNDIGFPKTRSRVSRFALRLSMSRAGDDHVILAAGFDENHDIFLSKKSRTWRTVRTLPDSVEFVDACDGLTSNGIFVLKSPYTELAEVSVLGQMIRRRSPFDRKDNLTPSELSNRLEHGTIVDIGVPLIWDDMKHGGDDACTSYEARLEFINQQRSSWWTFPACNHAVTTEPAWDGAAHQCPRCQTVGPCYRVDPKPLMPTVYPHCGHVVPCIGTDASGCDECPACGMAGPSMRVGIVVEPVIDVDLPTHVFNPCGHVASETVCNRWATLNLPSAGYICPYCGTSLTTLLRYSRLAYADPTSDGS